MLQQGCSSRIILNITNLMRDDGNGSGIDNLSYVYPASGGKTINNRLRHIVDYLTPNDNGKGVVGQDPDNYSYDATGNLTADATEGITSITWTPYNKIRELVKTNAAPATGTTTLRYLYDAAGNRVVKDYHATQNTTLTSRTWYIRDAQGTVLAIYTRKPTAGNSGSVTRTEAPIYGSSRIGQSTRTATYDATASGEATLLGTVYSRELGKRAYELVDHLGNVRATISDILVPRTATNTYDADVLTLTDYYPFGMQMDARTWEASGVAGHRYGYNGKENDDEVKGQGNQQDYGFRIYDPRVARFLSVDPLARDYPWYTPYQFAGNTPIQAIDMDGLEPAAVLAKAEEFIGTPYEYGGKKPAFKGGYPSWLPKSTYLAYIGYPSSAMTNIPTADGYGSSAANRCKIQLTEIVEIQRIMRTSDCGIDCSGLAVYAFNADQEKRMADLPRISANAIKARFVQAQSEGLAKVETDFTLISEGDLVFRNNHIMIATGNTRTKGKTLQIEVIEAPATGREVSKNWVTPKKGWSFGHVARTTDKVENAPASSEGVKNK